MYWRWNFAYRVIQDHSKYDACIYADNCIDPLDDGAILFLKSLLMTSNPDFHGTNPLLTSKSRTDKIPEAS